MCAYVCVSVCYELSSRSDVVKLNDVGGLSSTSLDPPAVKFTQNALLQCSEVFPVPRRRDRLYVNNETVNWS